MVRSAEHLSLGLFLEKSIKKGCREIVRCQEIVRLPICKEPTASSLITDTPTVHTNHLHACR